MQAQLKHHLITSTAVARTGHDTSDHPWRTSRRNGVVTVERASRVKTPEELEARARLKTAVCMEWTRNDASAAVLAGRYGMTREALLGIVYRAGLKRGRSVCAPSIRALSLQRRDRYLIRFLSASWSVQETAEVFGLTPETVRGVQRRCRREGILPTATVMPATRATATRVAQVIVCSSVPRVSLIEAAHGQCRALGDDGLCCCASVTPGRSWCPEHCAAFTQPARRRAVA